MRIRKLRHLVGYAASHCQGIHHAHLLRHGGELLTHVTLNI